jgi:NAD(P)-dependent dehydrogenase (short-subunit alcohol dehydrogenase family)
LSGRLETIEETAERVTARGGIGISAVVDHASPGVVQALLARIEQERGKLDILVNAIWGGDALLEFGKAFWQLNPFTNLSELSGLVVVTDALAMPSIGLFTDKNFASILRAENYMIGQVKGGTRVLDVATRSCLLRLHIIRLPDT